MSWLERAVDRSASVQRSRLRVAQQARLILDAARALIRVKGDEFTTQELIAEAGVALQTFYRYFSSKDELLLAVISDATTDACQHWAQAAAELPDPLARLRYYLMAMLELMNSGESEAGTARFIASMHARLHRHFPTELADAEKPFLDLIRHEVNSAVEAGLLNPADPESDSWFVSELVRSVYHHYAFVAHSSDEIFELKEKLWRFCMSALGATEPNP